MFKLTNIFLHITRIFLGTIFLAAGLNGYFVLFGFEPFIATSPEAMALFKFDYLLMTEKSLEIVCGVLLLIRWFIPLALALLFPIVINIFLLHLFVDPSLLFLAVMIFFTYIYLLFCYRNNFKSLMEKKPKPSH